MHIAHSRAKNSAPKDRNGLLASGPIKKTAQEKTVDHSALQTNTKNNKKRIACVRYFPIKKIDKSLLSYPKIVFKIENKNQFLDSCLCTKRSIGKI